MFLGFLKKDYLQYSNELARVPVILCKLQISDRFVKLIDIKKNGESVVMVRRLMV
jgi:hypothetical protein